MMTGDEQKYSVRACATNRRGSRGPNDSTLEPLLRLDELRTVAAGHAGETTEWSSHGGRGAVAGAARGFLAALAILIVALVAMSGPAPSEGTARGALRVVIPGDLVGLMVEQAAGVQEFQDGRLKLRVCTGDSCANPEQDCLPWTSYPTWFVQSYHPQTQPGSNVSNGSTVCVYIGPEPPPTGITSRGVEPSPSAGTSVWWILGGLLVLALLALLIARSAKGGRHSPSS